MTSRKAFTVLGLCFFLIFISVVLTVADPERAVPAWLGTAFIVWFLKEVG